MKIKSFVKKTIQIYLTTVTRLLWSRKVSLGYNTIMIDCKIFGNRYGEISIGDNCRLQNVRFHISKESGNKILIGNGVNLVDTEFILRNGGDNTIIIGNYVTTGGSVQFAACEGKTISVGEDCQFAHNIQLWTNDHHPIYSAEGRRVNPAKDIKIGKHVWIGSGCMILKGCKIDDGNVIGARSMITKNIQEKNCIFAGSPLKKVKENIKWERDF